MLVSGHTISIWPSWGYVPTHIQDMLKHVERTDKDLIIFIPRVVSNGVELPDFLKALDVGEGTRTTTGDVYVSKVR
jgi:hypothetical protein